MKFHSVKFRSFIPEDSDDGGWFGEVEEGGPLRSCGEVARVPFGARVRDSGEEVHGGVGGGQEATGSCECVVEKVEAVRSQARGRFGGARVESEVGADQWDEGSGAR